MAEAAERPGNNLSPYNASVVYGKVKAAGIHAGCRCRYIDRYSLGRLVGLPVYHLFIRPISLLRIFKYPLQAEEIYERCALNYKWDGDLKDGFTHRCRW